MENNSGGTERDFDVFLGVLYPVQDTFDVVLFHAEIVTVADSALEEHADGVW